MRRGGQKAIVKFLDYFGNPAETRISMVWEEPDFLNFSDDVAVLKVFENDDREPVEILRIPMYGYAEIPDARWRSLMQDVILAYEREGVAALVKRQKFNALARYPGQLTPYC